MIDIIINDAPFSGNVAARYTSGSQMDIQIGIENDEAIVNFMPLSKSQGVEQVEIYLDKNLIFSLYNMIKAQEKRKAEASLTKELGHKLNNSY